MFSNIKITLLNVTLLSSFSLTQAMLTKEDVITLDHGVSNPLCICYLNDNYIAVGGSNGITVVDLKKQPSNTSDSQKLIPSDNPIYQLLPLRNSEFVAVDSNKYYLLNLLKLDRQQQHRHNGVYFYVDENSAMMSTIDTFCNIQLRPHRKNMPKNILSKNYVAATMSSSTTLALLQTNKKLEIWHYPEDTNMPATLKKIFDLSQIEPKMATSFPFYIQKQRLSFSPDGLHIAVALPNACFVIPLPLAAYSHLYGYKTINKLLCFLYQACETGKYWLPQEIKYTISTIYFLPTEK